MKVVFIAASALMAAVSVQALADCNTFNSTCSCPAKKVANPTCGPFSATCACTGAYSDNINEGKQFCENQQKSCQNNVCNGAILDSFSCDPYSFSSQCLCRSLSLQRGGPAMSSNDTACMDLMNKCRTETCRGKKVAINQCTDPKNAKCQCEGDAARNTNDANELVSTGFTATIAALAVAFPMMLL